MYIKATYTDNYKKNIYIFNRRIFLLTVKYDNTTSANKKYIKYKCQIFYLFDKQVFSIKCNYNIIKNNYLYGTLLIFVHLNNQMQLNHSSMR